MMERTTTIFLYEALTGGGAFLQPGAAPPQGSLLAEGQAMAAALADDLLSAGCRGLCSTWDSRLPPPPSRPGHRWTSVGSQREHDGVVLRHARQADCTLVIAPESQGHLLRMQNLVSVGARRVLGVTSDVLAWSCHKHRTADRLAHAGVPCPTGTLVAAGSFPTTEGWDGPLIAKPTDGAGSIGVRRIDHPGDLSDVFPCGQEMRLERFCPGAPASVAMLTGPRGTLLLPTCLQTIAEDGSFQYQGGEVLADGPLHQRGQRLAGQVAQLLPDCCGFVGIDLILGPASDGTQDRVVEVNPRLTSSYLGLRASTQDNLAAAMLQVAAGHIPALTFPHRPLRFQLAGLAGAA